MTKEMLNKMVAEIRTEVEGMKVAEMRKVATTYGIKKPSQYKRVELIEKLVDQMTAVRKSVIEAEEEAKAAEKKAEKKVKKNYYKPVATEDNKNLAERKARYERLRNAIENFDLKVDQVLAGNATEEQLAAMERDVLVEAAKVLKVAGWYKLHNKAAMVKAIREVVA